MKPVLAVSIAGLVFLLLHLLGLVLPVEYSWGYDAWNYIPGWSVAILLIAGLAVCLTPVVSPSRLNFTRPDLSRRGVLLVLLPALSVLLFWVFRQESFFLGDGYFYIRTIENGVFFRPLEPLETFLHAAFYSSMNQLTGMSGQTAWALVSCLAGGLFVLVSMLTARHLGRSPAHETILFLSLVTIGTMQLYFGYIETYSLATLFALLFVYLTIRSFERRSYVYLAFLGFGLSVSAHLSMAAYAPAFVYLFIHHFRSASSSRRRLAMAGLSAIVFLVPPVLTLLIFAAGGFQWSNVAGEYSPGGHVLPLLPGKYTTTIAYSLFSYRHLIDMANLYVLIAPVLLFLPVLAVLGRGRWKLFFSRPAHRFLLIASVSVFAASFMFNMEIGVSRDWDIFSSASVPVTLLIIMAFLAVLEDRAALAGAVVIGCCLLHTLPWVYVNSSEERSRHRFEALSGSSHWNKHARSYAFDELRAFYEERNELKTSLEWARKAYDTLGNQRYRDNLTAVLNNIAIALAKEDRYDEAEPYFLNAHETDPEDFITLKNITLFYLRKSDYPNALLFGEKGLAVRPDDLDMTMGTARACYQLGRYQDADRYLNKAARIDSSEAVLQRISIFRRQLDKKLQEQSNSGG